MAETWDLSLLIDTSTKIFDARGMTGHHLGVEARNPARPLLHRISWIPTIAARFAAAWSRWWRGKLEIVRVRVLTRQRGAQEFFATLRDPRRPRGNGG